MKEHYVAAVIVAAGSYRMNVPVNKQYLLLHGKPILAHTLAVLRTRNS